MKLVSQAQMRAMDAKAIESGIPGLELMERAGAGILRSLKRRVSDVSRIQIWILCGKGNNGGDGYVLARLLREQGCRARLFSTCEESDLRGDALQNLQNCVDLGIPVEFLGADSQADLLALAPTDLIVDAVLGTGLSGAARGVALQWIDLINESPARVLAVDIPSGLNADSSELEGSAVAAEWTVTMAWPKRSFLFGAARARVGYVDVVDIGIPEAVTAEVGFDAEIPDPSVVRTLLPDPGNRDHKGRWGKILLVGGSPGLIGAPILATRAALRSGAGLVRVGLPASQTSIFDNAVQEAMSLALPEGEDGQLLARGAQTILSSLGGWDALCVGPGLGRFPETERLVMKLLGGWNGPMLVDADGLNILAKWGPDSWVPRARDLRAGGAAGGLVLTPHAGELSRLTGTPASDLLVDPIATARVWADRWQSTLVFKGAPSVIAAPDGRTWVNPTGNSGLATGGSGDLLSGMIVAFLGQGLDGPGAAVLGCYLHGLAADLWVSEGDRAQRSLLPSDVIETLPRAIRSVERGQEPPRWIWRQVPE